MPEDLDDHETKTMADTGLYLAEAMFPGDVLPDYAGISTKQEAKHYAAVQASTSLGEIVIELLQKLKDVQTTYYKLKDLYTDQTTKDTKKTDWNKYVKDAQKLKLDIDKEILISYRTHVKNQLTHSVSIKGHGRKEVSGIQMTNKGGPGPVPVHKRSKWEKITGGNKEPRIGERPNI